MIESPREGLKDMLIRLEDELGRTPSDEEATYYVQSRCESPTRPMTFKGQGWMEYTDTRTGETWWEQFDALEWRVRQLTTF